MSALAPQRCTYCETVSSRLSKASMWIRRAWARSRLWVLVMLIIRMALPYGLLRYPTSVLHQIIRRQRYRGTVYRLAEDNPERTESNLSVPGSVRSLIRWTLRHTKGLGIPLVRTAGRKVGSVFEPYLLQLSGVEWNERTCVLIRASLGLST